MAKPNHGGGRCKRDTASASASWTPLAPKHAQHCHTRRVAYRVQHGNTSKFVVVLNAPTPAHSSRASLANCGVLVTRPPWFRANRHWPSQARPPSGCAPCASQFKSVALSSAESGATGGSIVLKRNGMTSSRTTSNMR